MKVGDRVQWQDWDDEPPTVGVVIEVDEKYDYVTARYKNSDGDNMVRMAPRRDFSFVMGAL